MAKIYIFENEYVYQYMGASYPMIQNPIVENKTYYFYNYSDLLGSVYVYDSHSTISAGGITFDPENGALTEENGMELYVSLCYDDAEGEGGEEGDDTPTVTSNSFNGQMTAIADAVRSKASVSGKMGIIKMITTLNNLSTSGSSDTSSYDETDFESCACKLCKVINAKGNTFGTMTFAEMPAKIKALSTSSSPSTNYCYCYTDSGWEYKDINSLPEGEYYHYSGDCAYCSTPLVWNNSYFDVHCPSCGAYIRLYDGGTGLLEPPSGSGGDDDTYYSSQCLYCYNELTWYGYDVGSTITCSSCDNTMIAREGYLDYYESGETYYYCNGYLGEDQWCDNSGPYGELCPICSNAFTDETFNH